MSEVATEEQTLYRVVVTYSNGDIRSVLPVLEENMAKLEDECRLQGLKIREKTVMYPKPLDSEK